MLFGQHIHVSGRKKKRVIDYSNIHISTAPLFFTSALQVPQPLSVTRPRSAVADKRLSISVNNRLVDVRQYIPNVRHYNEPISDSFQLQPRDVINRPAIVAT